MDEQRHLQIKFGGIYQPQTAAERTAKEVF